MYIIVSRKSPTNRRICVEGKYFPKEDITYLGFIIISMNGERSEINEGKTSTNRDFLHLSLKLTQF